MKKISEEIKKAIVEEKLQNSKISTYQLAEKYSISPTSVIKILRQAGINTSASNIRQIRKEEIYKFIEEKLAEGTSWRSLTKLLKEKFKKSEAWARNMKRKWKEEKENKKEEVV
jgi:hypothetical protein